MASEDYPDGFTWSTSTRRYRDKATGRFIKATAIQSLRDQFVETQYRFAENMAASLADGGMTLRKWESEFWARVERVYIAEYMAGRGGINAMTAKDRANLSRMLTRQRKFLRNFAEDIATGDLSEDMIAFRSKLYISSATQAFERGKASAWNIRLPAYPGDGSTACMANCRCWWEISEKADLVRAYWRLSVAEHCKDCLGRATRWSPYEIERG